MAFQRPFLISLKRGDSHARWGFSIKGGIDYGEPLKIQMVTEDSLAEQFGLHEGDEVIQVGRVNVQDLSLGQAHELLARCGNKIEMFVVREDLFSPRKAKEPPVVRSVVHNPYNSPLSLYSTENIADTLAKQTEVLTEGHVSSTEEEDGPENLSFKQKSAVFQLLDEQNKQDKPQPVRQESLTVKKPKAPPPPPPPRPKPPADIVYNGHDSTQQQFYQDQQRSTGRVEYQTTHKTVSQYQQEPTQHRQTIVHQSYQQSPGYQSSSRETVNAPRYPTGGYEQPTAHHQSPAANYQQSYQQQISTSQYQQQSYQTPVAPTQHSTSYQQSYQQQVSQNQYQQGYQSPVATNQHPGYESPTYQAKHQVNFQQNKTQEQQRLQQQSTAATYQQQNQSNYQQSRHQDHQRQQQQSTAATYQHSRSQDHQRQQHQVHQSHTQQSGHSEQAHPQRDQQSTAVSKAELRIGPAPPPRVSSQVKQQKNGDMTAVYKNQYEHHLQKQQEHQQRMLMNHADDERHRANLVSGDIFEHNSTSGAPITYKAPQAAPSKPDWPPPPSGEPYRENTSPTGMMDVSSVWPPKRSTAVDLPRTGFNPAAVREQGGNGRRCVWPPPCEDFRSGRTTPQSPVGGRKIQWNPSPSPPTARRGVYISPSRRRDVQWPPPSPTQLTNGHGGFQSPRLSRKAQFDEYVTQHASINVPQTYRPPPGTQHVEFH